MKTILTFVGGGDRDEVILRTALAAAMPLSAHLDCLHARVPAMLAARYAHTEFATGAALRNALEELGINAEAFSALAAEHVRAFCENAGIEMCEAPAAGRGVTASFREEESNARERLNHHASQGDLVLIGRARQKQGLAPDTLEHLVRNCGRPVLVAASAAPRTLTDTIMVCWKDSASTAAAVTAAAPLLAKARRVVFVGAAKRDGGLSDALGATAREVAGERAEARFVQASGRGVPEALSAAAEECSADLVVTGAYGRSRGREILFGSCTDRLLDHIDRPMLLMH
jgi:nucleotide-binding universal stress UspA family protein